MGTLSQWERRVKHVPRVCCPGVRSAGNPAAQLEALVSYTARRVQALTPAAMRTLPAAVERMLKVMGAAPDEEGPHAKALTAECDGPSARLRVGFNLQAATHFAGEDRGAIVGRIRHVVSAPENAATVWIPRA